MFLLLSLRLHPPGLVHGRCCFPSLRLISCLSLPLTAFFFRCLSWGLLAAAGLSCAVICHTTEVEKKHFLLMLPPPLLVSHCFSPFSFLPSSQFSTSPLLFLQKSPKDQFIGEGYAVPKCQAVIQPEAADSEEELGCWLNGCSHTMGSLSDLDFIANCTAINQGIKAFRCLDFTTLDALEEIQVKSFCRDY